MPNVRDVVKKAGVMVQGHFIFADGAHAATKLEMDRLWEHPKELSFILDLLARADGLPEADLIVGVPTGGQRLALELVQSGRLQIPFIQLERQPGGAKQDFRYMSRKDESLARHAHSIRIYEDVVTTLSSVAGVVKLLNINDQQIHSLAIWRRGETKKKYRQGVVDHYLIEEPIPSFPAANCPICKSSWLGSVTSSRLIAERLLKTSYLSTPLELPFRVFRLLLS